MGLNKTARRSPALQQRWAHNLVPEGHALVAQVPLVPHERRAPTYDQQTQLATIATVYRQGKQSGDVMLNNIYALQFVPRQPDCMPVYVDIDPYLVVVK